MSQKMKITISSSDWQKLNKEAGIFDYFNKENRQRRKETKEDTKIGKEVKEKIQKAVQNLQYYWKRFVNLYGGDVNEASDAFMAIRERVKGSQKLAYNIVSIEKHSANINKKAITEDIFQKQELQRAKVGKELSKRWDILKTIFQRDTASLNEALTSAGIPFRVEDTVANAPSAPSTTPNADTNAGAANTKTPTAMPATGTPPAANAPAAGVPPTNAPVANAPAGTTPRIKVDPNQKINEIVEIYSKPENRELAIKLVDALKANGIESKTEPTPVAKPVSTTPPTPAPTKNPDYFGATKPTNLHITASQKYSSKITIPNA